MSKSVTSDRNLLFGILAWENGAITQTQFLDAMQRWTHEKHRTIGEILVDQGALGEQQHARLAPMVDAQIAFHGGDAKKSLSALSSIGSAADALAAVDDREVQASVAHVTSIPTNRDGQTSRDAATIGSVQPKESTQQRYRILRPHAKGALGEVFVARDNELNREVALKEIQIEHAREVSSQNRFLLEAEITGGLEHPGIVPVYGLGKYDDGRPFYAMRFIRGESLDRAIADYHESVSSLEKNNLQFRGLLKRFVDVCEAIAYAHSRGVLHRDLKPGNIMLGRYGESLVVDWGLATAQGDKGIQSDQHSNADERPLLPISGSAAGDYEPGSTLGTPGYMSPEQAEGRLDEIGRATDVYSMGATLYHILTGRPSQTGKPQGETLRDIVAGRFPKPRELKTGVPKSLEAVCLQAMATKPADRYKGVLELANDVERWLGDEPVSACTESIGAKTARWTRRHRSGAFAAVFTLLVLAVGSTAGAILLNEARDKTVAALAIAEDKTRIANEQTELTIKALSETEIQKELAVKALSETEIQKELAEKARDVAQIQTNKADAQRVIAVAASAEAEVERMKAEDERKKAEDQRDEKEKALTQAKIARQTALIARQKAEQASVEAERQREIAERQRKVAERRSYNAKLVEAQRFIHSDAKEANDLLNNTSLFPHKYQDFVWKLRQRQSYQRSPELGGHTSWVSGLQFESNQKLISAGRDGRVNRWMLQDVGNRDLLSESNRWISAIAIAPISGAIATGGHDNKIQLVVNGVTHELGSHDGPISSLCFSPDEQLLLSGGGSFVRLWRASDRTMIEEAAYASDGQSDVVNSVAFSPDGSTIAVGGTLEYVALLWENTQGKWLQGDSRTLRYDYQQGGTSSLRFSTDGLLLAAVNPAQCTVWDLETYDTQSFPSEGATTVTFALGGRALMTALDDGTIRALSTKGELMLEIPAHTDHAVSIAVSPSGKLFATGGRDQRIRLFDISSFGLDAIPTDAGTLCIAANQNTRVVASGRNTGAIDLWDGDSLTRKRILDSGSKAVLAIAFSPDGKWLASGGEDHVIRVWNLDSAGRPLLWTGHSETINDVKFSPDGKLLASASADGTVRLWDVAAGSKRPSAAEKATLSGHAGAVTSVEFHPDGKMLVSAGHDSHVRVWDVESNDQVQQLDGHTDWILSLCFSPAGETLYSGGRDKTLRFWDFGSDRIPAKTQPLHTVNTIDQRVSSITISPDGNTISTGSWGGAVNCWDAKSGEDRGLIPCDSGGKSLSLFAGPDQLLCLGISSTIWVWSVGETTTPWKPIPRETVSVEKRLADATLGESKTYRRVTGRRPPTKVSAKPSKPISNSLGMSLAFIDAGKFKMGSRESPQSVGAFFEEPESIFRREHPLHNVEISRSFYLSTRETTFSQFEAFVDATGYLTDEETDGQGFGALNPMSGNEIEASTGMTWRDVLNQNDENGSKPVHFVSWNDAVAFCRWLSKKEGATYRLPTEAEWEYACRAGTDSRYHSGSDPVKLTAVANIGGHSFSLWHWRMQTRRSRADGTAVIPKGGEPPADPFRTLAKVGSLKPNDWGIHDMHGNVWEWCLDGYDERFYEFSPVSDPLAPESKQGRVIRGGCFL